MLIDAVFDGSLQEAAGWAAQVQQSGRFHGGWVSDTNNDPFLLAQQFISATDALTVGTNIAVAFARSPYCVAQTSYNLAHLSKGRFVLGLGTQVKAHIEKRFSLEWPDKPATALGEYVSLLRHLYDCFDHRQRPSFRGEYYRCTLTSPVFTPDKHPYGPPRLGIAAVGPVMTRTAARVADAVFLHPFTHLKFIQEVSLPALERGRQQRDPTLGELEVVGFSFVLASDCPEYPKRKVATLGRLAFYASTPNYKPVLSLLGMDDLHTELHRLSREKKWDQMSRAVPPELVEACVVEAPREQLIEALEDRFGEVYDRVLIEPAPLL